LFTVHALHTFSGNRCATLLRRGNIHAAPDFAADYIHNDEVIFDSL
jgi:hypothetical protein